MSAVEADVARDINWHNSKSWKNHKMQPPKCFMGSGRERIPTRPTIITPILFFIQHCAVYIQSTHDGISTDTCHFSLSHPPPVHHRSVRSFFPGENKFYELITNFFCLYPFAAPITFFLSTHSIFDYANCTHVLKSLPPLFPDDRAS